VADDEEAPVQVVVDGHKQILLCKDVDTLIMDKHPERAAEQDSTNQKPSGEPPDVA
jgi:hypothetical protein